MRAATTQHHVYVAGASPRSGSAVLLIILSLCGFAGALATRLFDPLITSIAADFATPVSVVTLLSSAFALPFGLSQPFLGPTGDAFGKEVVIKVAVAILALCLLASTFAPDLKSTRLNS